MMKKSRGAVLDDAHGLGVLEELAEAGPLTLPEIPRRWPVIRPMLERRVRELVAEGLVEGVPSKRVPGKTAYSLTPRARATLAAR
jgi:DNA-binding HxlR family transcriptional regulator